MRYIVGFSEEISPSDVRIRKVGADRLTDKQLKQMDRLDIQTSKLHREWDMNMDLKRSKPRSPICRKDLEDIQNKGGFVMVATDHNDNILGYCFAGIDSDFYDGTVWLNDLVVDESVRGMGIGTRLVREALKELKSEGHRHVVLNVSLQNSPAIGLYEKTGFRPWEYTMVRTL